ncbi:MAG: winged helix-turn-helix domain-containing protein [Acidobacteriales bacterium]|nr:winged helix-turn-helix domain-containing protein [Terriglobales bacterium]
MSEERRVLCFGVFEAHLRTGELRKNGVKVRLQDQPFQVLTMLLLRHKELVTREELVRIVWPEDTFVDFDHSLNSAVNKLREVLNDSANTPRFIETLPKRGYRFLADVEVLGQDGLSAPASNGVATTAASDSMDDLPAVPRPLARTLFLLAQLMYLSFYVGVLAKMAEVHGLLGAVFGGATNVTAGAVLVTALIGIPVRFFFITAVGFDFAGFRLKYERIFFAVLLLDEFWGLAPLLVAHHIGFGLALAAMAALLYLPFGQRTLVQMAYRR